MKIEEGEVILECVYLCLYFLDLVLIYNIHITRDTRE
jgi:hypothetical protein